ncbi:MAG: carbon-nitrogen hydrolase family protein [Rhodospirillaceae bacterium]|nr:carbon-nitrogen hydrolase family protein [Rhodospirillaceae bacterium]
MTVKPFAAKPFIVACVQVNASNDMGANIKIASQFVRDAAAKGAELVLLPENVVMMEHGRDNVIAKALPAENHPALNAFVALAKELKIWLHCGSLAIKQDNGKLANRTFVVNPVGQVIATYDKIHMFDVNLGGGEQYNESATYNCGTKTAMVDLPWGKLGLTICYDVRFAHLYRQLAQAGADFLTVPAAFTQTTGEAHWHILLRARAIETGCFVFAPAQTGIHAGNRQTFGHALIIDPWGKILADAGTAPGFITVVIDPAMVAATRAKVPSLSLNARF